jgi:hypothetical protein
MVWGEKTRDWAVRVTAWHPWFAWHSVDLSDGRTAWLCWLDRKLDARSMEIRSRVMPGCTSLIWTYRLPEVK